MRICILGASLGTGNMGVSALASGTVAAALHSFPHGNVFLLDYGRVPARHQVRTCDGVVEVPLVNLRFSKKIYLRNNIAHLLVVASLAWLLPKRLRRLWLERYPCLKAILDADIVASLAGGDSFSDIYGLGRLLYVALPQILVLQLGRPLILLPQTLGPFGGRVARLIARYIMRRATSVCSRDQQGLDVAAALMGARAENLRFSYDMAFVLEPAQPDARLISLLPQRMEGEPLIGLNVSGLLLMGGYSQQNMFGLKADYVELVEHLVDYFIRQQNGHVLLVPHVFGDERENDSDACRWLYDRLQARFKARIHTLAGSFDQHEIKFLIGRCDFFVGARMHACIAAVSQSVPAVCLAYSRKFLGVMESVGRSELVADLRTLDSDGVLGRVHEVFTARTYIQDALQSRMPEVRAGVFELLSADNRSRTEDRGARRDGREMPKSVSPMRTG